VRTGLEILIAAASLVMTLAAVNLASHRDSGEVDPSSSGDAYLSAVLFGTKVGP
jgi:hypothetical protein